MSTVSFLSQLYTNILGRQPDASGLAWWADAIDSGRANAAEVTRDFIASPEFGGVVQPLARLYYAAFGRIPDADGLQYWTQNAQHGQSYAEIVQYFAGSPEFAKLYGQLDHAAFLDALSQTALGHGMDASARATWLAQLTSGSSSRADVLSSVVSSNEMATAKAGEVKAIAAYYGTLGTMPTPAELAAALASNDPAALITKLYASAAYQGVAAPGLIAHGTITDALGHNATVFIDTNANGKLDAGEASVKADGAGNFDFGTAAAFRGQLTVQGTGGAVTAPAGATVVNALTTLVHSLAASQHLDTAAAEHAFSSALGLTGWDLLHTDFTATAADPTQAQATRDAAAQVQAMSAQLATVISQTGAALQGLGLAADAVSAGAAAVQAVSTFIADPTRQGAADLADSGTIQALVKAAGALLQASPAQLAMLGLAAPELAKAIVNVNSALAHASGSAAWETINQIGTIEANAATVLAKLAGGDITGALGLTTLPALLKLAPVVMTGGGEGMSTSGPPTFVTANAYTDGIRLAFSEDIFAGSGKIIITDGASQTHYNSSTGQLESRAVGATDTRVVDVNDSHVTITDNKVWITFDKPLSSSNGYHVILNPGTLVDSDFNAFTGLADASSQYPVYHPSTSASATALSAAFVSLSDFAAGEAVTISVSFDQNVWLATDGHPTLALTGGRTAVYESGSGTSHLIFKYVVQEGEDASLEMEAGGGAGLAGQVESGAGLVLDSAHIHFTSLPSGYGTVHIDGVAPTYTLTMDNTTFDSGHKTATLTVAFSEVIPSSLFLATDFTAENGTIGSWTQSDDGTTFTATFTAADDVSDTTNVITYTPSVVADGAGNLATHTPATSTNYTVNTSSVTGLQALSAQFIANGTDYHKETGDVIYFDVTFDQSVTVDSGSPPTWSIDAGGSEEGIAQYLSGSGTATLRFTYTVQAGDSISDLDFIKTGGHNFLDAAHIVFDHIADGEYGAMHVDGIAPTLVADTGASFAGTLDLTFSEEVSNSSLGSFEFWRIGNDTTTPDFVINGGDDDPSSGHLDLLSYDTATHTQTIRLSPMLSLAGDYYVKVVGTPVHDYAGNDFVGLSSATDLVFHAAIS